MKPFLVYMLGGFALTVYWMVWDLKHHQECPAYRDWCPGHLFPRAASPFAWVYTGLVVTSIFTWPVTFLFRIFVLWPWVLFKNSIEAYCSEDPRLARADTYVQDTIDGLRELRRPRIWSASKEHKCVYFTCGFCRRILMVKNSEVNGNGLVREGSNCVTCECGAHTYPLLLGWNAGSAHMTGRLHWWSFKRPG